MYSHALHRGKKHICSDSAQSFRTAEMLKCHIKDCFKIDGKRTTKTPKKKLNTLDSKIKKVK